MGGDATRTFVHQTDHVRADRARPDLVAFRRMDPANRPSPFKRYPVLEPRLLPDDLAASDLGRLLYLSAGVTRAARGAMGPTWFRAAPAAGNLHPNELYVVCSDRAEIEAGVHHYEPAEHALTTLRRGDYRLELAEAALIGRGAEADALIVITGMPWRTGWKYGERGLRHLYWDAGALLANLLAVAGASELPARVFVGFDDERVGALLGLEPQWEYPLALVALGTPEGAPGSRVVAAGRGVQPLELTVEEPSSDPLHFPLADTAQHAGDLSGPEDVKEWRRAAATARGAAVGAPTSAPAEHDAGPIEQVILRRGSTRMFRRDTAPRSLLDWAVADAWRAVPLDAVPPGGTLLEAHLSVHAVEGVEPGAYVWRRGRGLDQIRAQSEEEARAAAAHLCLDQPIGGDAAYTAFLGADLDAVLDRLGDRGYRAALLEAGIVAGRLQLAAFALGFGGTGLTFWDEEASAWFGTTAAPMIVVAVGVPATEPAPSGTPRKPAVLGGYGELMERMMNDMHFRRR